ncbi:MAG: autotransporter outer rane beta-barrel protein [Caulobacter sp.]|nr:autotransporter outer rane beta-barrel protein [Caulobacter sp.]
MSQSTPSPRRAGLFATSSLVAVSATLLGLGGLTLTPTRALAANECGNPAANAGAADSFTCAAATYPTGIIYPATDGDLTLNLDEDASGAVVTTTGGIQVNGLAGDDLALGRTVTVAGTGDPSIINTLGSGISFTSPDSAIAINLTDGDGGDTAIVVTGSTNGIVANGGGAGNVGVTLSNGAVTGQAGDGIDATSTGGSATVAIGGASVNASNTGLGASNAGISVSGATGMTVTGSGAVTATADQSASAISAIGDGPIVINETGAITANGTYAWGVYAEGTAGGTINITTANITVNQPGGPFGGGDGISAYTTGAVTISSGNISTTGLYADGIVVGGGAGIAGDTVITSGAVTTTGDQSDGIDVGAHGLINITSNAVTTTGAFSNGIEADSDLSTVAINSTGAISATGAGSDGIHAAGANGVTITTHAITAGARGIDASSSAGNVLITGAGGTIRANAGDGIDAVSTTGTATVALNASNVNASNTGIAANSYGVSVSGATGVNVTGTGSITATGGNNAIGIYTNGPGPIVINETGTITANGTYAWGVYAQGSGGGTINITTANIVVNQPGGPAGGGEGISAYSVGATTINSGTITTTGIGASGIRVGGAGALEGNTTVTSGAITTTGPNSTGIVVGAHGSIAITSGAITTTGANSSGIVAATDLSTVAVTSNGALSATGTGAVGINATGQTGVTVNANGAVTATTNGIKTNQAGVGAGVINVGANGVVRGAGTSLTTAAIDTTTLSGQTTTINNAGVIRSTNATVAGSAADLAIRGTGGNTTVVNTGRIDGRMDFSGLTGVNKATVTNAAAGQIHTTGVTTFSGGNDALTNAGLLATTGATTYDFAGDTAVAPRDVFSNSGRLVAGETTGASTFTVAGLETFNNSGSVFFGSLDAGTTSDGQTNDRIVMTGTGGGTAFVGSGAGALFMDANLGVATQTNCAAAVTADCLSLPGGTVTGSTKIRINNTNTGPGGLNTTGIVLVDATGGSIAAGSLVIDPASVNYVTRGGAGAIDTGFFFYRLIPVGTTQAALVSTPDNEAFEFSRLGTAATDTWYTTTGTWFNRQADIRNDLDGADGSHPGVWLKVVGDWSDRKSSGTYTSLGTTFTYDLGYKANTAGLIGGVDLMGAREGGKAWVIGVDLGYVDSDVRFGATSTRVSMSGTVVGIYGSWVNGPWYLDATVSGNFLNMEDSIPSLGATAAVPVPVTPSGNVRSIGGQVETGWRFGLGESAWWEPTASLAYVSTKFDNLAVPGGTVTFDDVKSFRGSLGLRVASKMTYTDFSLQPSLYARVWDEWKGDNRTTLTNPGLPIVGQDSFQGAFADVGGQLNLYSAGGLSAFIDASYKWNDDYKDTTLTAGFHYRF